jgi:hypothetical protein
VPFERAKQPPVGLKKGTDRLIAEKRFESVRFVKRRAEGNAGLACRYQMKLVCKAVDARAGVSPGSDNRSKIYLAWRYRDDRRIQVWRVYTVLIILCETARIRLRRPRPGRNRRVAVGRWLAGRRTRGILIPRRLACWQTDGIKSRPPAGSSIRVAARA